eukprot:3815-Pelagococcus_subviridis.AAC.6
MTPPWAPATLFASSGVVGVVADDADDDADGGGAVAPPSPSHLNIPLTAAAMSSPPPIPANASAFAVASAAAGRRAVNRVSSPASEYRRRDNAARNNPAAALAETSWPFSASTTTKYAAEVRSFPARVDASSKSTTSPARANSAGHSEGSDFRATATTTAGNRRSSRRARDNASASARSAARAASDPGAWFELDGPAWRSSAACTSHSSARACASDSPPSSTSTRSVVGGGGGVSLSVSAAAAAATAAAASISPARRRCRSAHGSAFWCLSAISWQRETEHGVETSVLAAAVIRAPRSLDVIPIGYASASNSSSGSRNAASSTAGARLAAAFAAFGIAPVSDARSEDPSPPRSPPRPPPCDGVGVAASSPPARSYHALHPSTPYVHHDHRTSAEHLGVSATSSAPVDTNSASTPSHAGRDATCRAKSASDAPRSKTWRAPPAKARASALVGATRSGRSSAAAADAIDGIAGSISIANAPARMSPSPGDGVSETRRAGVRNALAPAAAPPATSPSTPRAYTATSSRRRRRVDANRVRRLAARAAVAAARAAEPEPRSPPRARAPAGRRARHLLRARDDHPGVDPSQVPHREGGGRVRGVRRRAPLVFHDVEHRHPALARDDAVLAAVAQARAAHRPARGRVRVRDDDVLRARVFVEENDAVGGEQR